MQDVVCTEHNILLRAFADTKLVNYRKVLLHATADDFQSKLNSENEKSQSIFFLLTTLGLSQ